MARDIGEWLEHLGLGEHIEAFAANKIDASVLASLTNDDLREIGVQAVGDRRKLLNAITTFGETNAGAADIPVDNLAPEPQPSKDAERRQLTVMFCDLVGSTELSERLDPEEMREIMRVYQEACAAQIERFDGHIAKFLGDGILVYFGFPQAHEEDAERAVRAGLAIVDAIAGLAPRAGQPLAARIGIATGIVVVGDLVGAGVSEVEAVTGPTPNLAARLQTLAQPNSVVIAPGTRQLLGAVFDYENLGRHTLKGIAAPVQAWKVRGERHTESRFEAFHIAEITPFVGRDEEIDLLLRRWEQARDGEGQVVLLSGEPGIGKSRIVRALGERITEQGHIRLHHQCSPFFNNTALYPFITELEFAAGLKADDPPEGKLDKLEDVLSQSTGDVAAIAPLFATLLSISAGDRYPPLDLTPQRRKEKTLDALVDRLDGLAAQAPVMMILEDAHWADATTQELMAMIVDRSETLSVLVIITFRPTFVPPWSAHGHVTALALNRLGRRHCAALAKEVAGGTALPDELLNRIVAKTDGVPLFVEELTKTVLDLGWSDDAGDRDLSSGASLFAAIPATLQDSLMARLDRDSTVKKIAQIGAVIGREFSHELLATVADRASADVDATLDRLVDSGLAYRRGNAPACVYSFKHALVQDTAYNSLLRSKRRQLHAQVAKALEAGVSDTGAPPELLAHHYSEADLAAPAITNWHLAGQQAAQRAANLEAIQYFQRALDLLKSLPEDHARDATELKVLTLLGPALMVVKGWAAEEVGTAYERANVLAGRLERSADLVPPLVGIWLFHNARGRYDLADALTEELFHVAKTTADRGLLLQAHHAGWPIPMFRGAFESSNAHIEKGLALYDYDQHKHHALLYMGHDPAVCAHACGAQAVWALGLPDRAERHGTDALELARRLGHTPTLAFALWYVSGAHTARGDAAAVLSAAEELLPLSREQKLVQTEAGAQLLGGWALAVSGQAREGLEQMRAGFDIWTPTGMRTWLQMFTTLYGDGLLRAERYVEGLEALDQALEIGQQTGERWWESRIHHLRGEALLHSGDGDGATQSLQTAIQVAQAQGAKSLELRAATRLAQLWAEGDKRDHAHDLLAPIYGWFREGFDTPDLKDAKALLDDVS